MRLTHENLNDDAFRKKAVDLLRLWIRDDRQTVARFHLGVPFIDARNDWITNVLPTGTIIRMHLLATDPRQGMNIERLARALAPSLVALGAHLQHQGNEDAFRLIPLLEWVEMSGHGPTFVGDLREKLSRARDEKVSPATYL